MTTTCVGCEKQINNDSDDIQKCCHCEDKAVACGECCSQPTSTFYYCNGCETWTCGDCRSLSYTCHSNECDPNAYSSNVDFCSGCTTERTCISCEDFVCSNCKVPIEQCAVCDQPTCSDCLVRRRSISICTGCANASSAGESGSDTQSLEPDPKRRSTVAGITLKRSAEELPHKKSNGAIV